MIVLAVEDYCQNCGDFEPVKDTVKYHSGFEIVDRHTTVKCKWAERCTRIKEYLKESEKKCEELQIPEPIEIEKKTENEPENHCSDCRYLDTMSYEEPCRSCGLTHDNWEPV